MTHLVLKATEFVQNVLCGPALDLLALDPSYKGLPGPTGIGTAIC